LVDIILFPFHHANITIIPDTWRPGSFNLWIREELLLAVLVTLIEHINTAGGIDDLHLAGVERVRCVGNLKLYEGVLDTVNGDVLLAGGAGAGDEHVLV
jgi:hypothetical protein